MQGHNYADIGDSLSIVLHAPRENDKDMLCTLYLWNSFELFDNIISHTIPVKSTNIKLKTIQKKKKKSAILTQICLCLIDTSCFFLFISFTSIVKRWRDFVCFPDKCRLSFTLCCYSNFVNVFIVCSSFINIQCCATRGTLCTCTSRRTFIQ